MSKETEKRSRDEVTKIKDNKEELSLHISQNNDSEHIILVELKSSPIYIRCAKKAKELGITVEEVLAELFSHGI